MDCGVRMTTIASTRAPFRSTLIAASYRALVASPMTSTGFWTAAVGGRCFRRAVWVLSVNSASLRPVLTAASVARIPGPPALVTIATLLPRGIGR